MANLAGGKSVPDALLGLTVDAYGNQSISTWKSRASAAVGSASTFVHQQSKLKLSVKQAIRIRGQSSAAKFEVMAFV